MFNPSDHYVHVLAIMPGDEENCRRKVQAITDTFKESDQGTYVENCGEMFMYKCSTEVVIMIPGKDVRAVVEFEKTHKKQHPNLLQDEKKKPSPYRAGWWVYSIGLLHGDYGDY